MQNKLNILKWPSKKKKKDMNEDKKRTNITKKKMKIEIRIIFNPSSPYRTSYKYQNVLVTCE